MDAEATGVVVESVSDCDWSKGEGKGERYVLHQCLALCIWVYREHDSLTRYRSIIPIHLAEHCSAIEPSTSARHNIGQYQSRRNRTSAALLFQITSSALSPDPANHDNGLRLDADVSAKARPLHNILRPLRTRPARSALNSRPTLPAQRPTPPDTSYRHPPRAHRI